MPGSRVIAAPGVYSVTIPELLLVEVVVVSLVFEVVDGFEAVVDDVVLV